MGIAIILVCSLIGTALYMLSSGSQQMPQWELLTAGVLFSISTAIYCATGNPMALRLGGFITAISLFLLYFTTANLTEMSSRQTQHAMMSMLPHIPLIGAFLSVFASINMDSKPNSKSVIHDGKGNTRLADVKGLSRLQVGVPAFVQIRFYRGDGEWDWEVGDGYQRRLIVRRAGGYYEVNPSLRESPRFSHGEESGM